MGAAQLMEWEKEYKQKLISAEDAAALIYSNDVVGISCGSSMPFDILNEINKRYQDLTNVTIVSGLMMMPPTPLEDNHLETKYQEHIHHVSFFMGAFERKYLKEGNVNLAICQFSKLDTVLQDRFPCNVAVMECSAPDEDGNMSFGPCGSISNHIWSKQADKIIVQVNKRTPYIYGINSTVHVSDVDHICEKDHELPVPFNRQAVSENSRKIASYLMEHIPDGSTVQLGVGGVSNAVGFLLEEKNDLGIHTEMLTDSLVELAQMGVANGSKKNFHPNKMLFCFGAGERKLYDYIHRNPMVEVAPISYVNNINNIAKNDHMISINNALSIDLTGQVCSESIGFNQYSGTGGQLDFVRGAQLSKGGKSFITLESTAKTSSGTVSKITAALLPGTIVTTPRTDVQYVVTEYGIADLGNQCIKDRVNALIAIAHPDFRDQLQEDAKAAKLIG